MGIIGSDETNKLVTVLSKALFKFSGFDKAAAMTRAQKGKINLSPVGCVRQKKKMFADYCLLWHLEKIVYFQQKFRGPEDIIRYILDIEQREFNFYEEFEHIQNTFVVIIMNDVMKKDGVFNWGNDTLQSPRS